MFKQSPSRHNRSKGIKVKHILQICVLLAVCIWLIYQVKHSREKRQEYEVKDDKDVGKVQSDSVIPRIGRRDIPRITEIDANGEKHEEDEDEKDGEEEDNKHEEDESEIEDVKIVEREEEGGGGDDEIDEHEPEKTETESEHEPEKTETESEHEEEAEDEDNEREEKEDVTEENHTENEENDDAHEGQPEKEDNEENAEKEVHTESEDHGDVGKEDHSEQEVTLDDQDHDVGRTNTREAQEVLYRADDASSEVAHNVQSVISETENVTSGHGYEMWRKINFGQEHENKTSDNAEVLIKPKVQPREDVNPGTSYVTVTEPKNYNVNLTKPDDSSLQNSTLPEITSNSTVVVGEHSATLLSNETQTTLDSNVSQNGTVELLGDKEPKLPGNVLEQDVKTELATDDKSRQEASADANKAEGVNTNAGESLISHNSTFSTSHDTTNDKDAKEAAKNNSVDNENKGDKSVNNGEAASDEISESHSDEVTGRIQHDPIDASDTTALTQEERESRTDLDTLPEIRNEIQNTEEVVSE